MFELAFAGPIRRPVMPRPAEEHKLGFRSAEARLHFQDLMNDYYDAMDAFMADIARRKNQIVLGMDRDARKRAIQTARKAARGGKDVFHGMFLNGWNSPGYLLVLTLLGGGIGINHRMHAIGDRLDQQMNVEMRGAGHAPVAPRREHVSETVLRPQPVHVEAVRSNVSARRPRRDVVVEDSGASFNPSGPVPFFEE